MRYFYLLFVLIPGSVLLAQDATSLEVYNILQEKCATCHNGPDAPMGLDLQGEGATPAARMQDVYTSLYQQSPANEAAADIGDAYIYPGRPDKSFLFRKINGSLESTISLNSNEGQQMPPYPVTNPITDVEKEMIRQWILYGAPAAGTLFDRNTIEDFYAGMGETSFPDGPPPAPAPGEGFQVKMGPFYIEPGGELEFFQKYELELPEDIEVDRLDMDFGIYSHHFLLYDFGSSGGNNIPHGLRLDPLHYDVSLVAAIQEPTDLMLPENTAFRWEEGMVVDLNSHYINYSANLVHQAEVYLNVYTQPTGTAAQEMKTELLVNGDIYIPNNDETTTHTDVVNYNLGEVYLWGIMGHTHQYGTSYKAWRRENFSATELIYDAACPLGTPGCIAPYFDYQHIPIRYFEPLEPLTMNFSNGIVHEAQWVNDGPTPVWFGPTSDDEMMVMVIMYTEDSTGIEVVATDNLRPEANTLSVSPTPATDFIRLSGPDKIVGGTLDIFTPAGQSVHRQRMDGSSVLVARNNLPAGMYVYQLLTDDGILYTGKMVWAQQE